MSRQDGWHGKVAVMRRLHAVGVTAGAIAAAACGWVLLVSPAAQPVPLYTALAAGGAQPAPSAPASGGLLTGVVTGGLVNGLVAGTNGLTTGLAAGSGGGGGSVAGISLTAGANGSTVAGVSLTAGSGGSGTVAGVQVTTGSTSSGTSLGVQVTTGTAAGGTVTGLSVTTGASLPNSGITVNVTTGGDGAGSIAGVNLTVGASGGTTAEARITTGASAVPTETTVAPISQDGGDGGSRQPTGNGLSKSGGNGHGGGGQSRPASPVAVPQSGAHPAPAPAAASQSEAQLAPAPPVAAQSGAQPEPANQLVPVAPPEPVLQPPAPAPAPAIIAPPSAPAAPQPQRQPVPTAVLSNIIPPASAAAPAPEPAPDEEAPSTASTQPTETIPPLGPVTNGGAVLVPTAAAATTSATATAEATALPATPTPEATAPPATPTPVATPASMRPPRATAPEPRDEGGSIFGVPVPRAVQDAALAAEPYFGFALGVLIVVLVAGARALIERRRDAAALATAAAMGGGPRPGREALVIVEGLKRQLEFSQAIAANLGEGIVVVDRAGRVTFANPTAETLLGQKAEELRGGVLAQALGAGGDALATLLAGTVKQEAPLRLDELRVALPDGEDRTLSVAAAPLLRDQRVVGVVLALHDATAERERIVALEQRALHDVLTGLPNRTLFEDRLERALALALREGTKVAVLFIDLDGFKAVNDTFGHQAGDALLREVARRLEGRLRRSDTVARLGGDEFALVLPRADVAGARVVAGEIAAALAEPIDALGYQAQVGASIGIAVAPDHGLDVATLVRCADLAMYQAKRGKLGIAVYQRELPVG